eukprot:1587406-Amphidinium_carterae.1
MSESKTACTTSATKERWCELTGTRGLLVPQQRLCSNWAKTNNRMGASSGITCKTAARNAPLAWGSEDLCKSCMRAAIALALPLRRRAVSLMSASTSASAKTTG